MLRSDPPRRSFRGASSGAGRTRPAQGRLRRVPWTAWVWAAAALAAVIVGGWAVWSRIASVQQGAVVADVPRGVRHDPATRARGAALSISGQESHPIAVYDPPSGTVTVRVQSRYYDPTHTAQLNREYLATEGRLVVQLVLYNDPEVSRAVVELYRGRQRLATVSGAPRDAYTKYAVTYASGLP